MFKGKAALDEAEELDQKYQEKKAALDDALFCPLHRFPGRAATDISGDEGVYRWVKADLKVVKAASEDAGGLEQTLQGVKAAIEGEAEGAVDPGAGNSASPKGAGEGEGAVKGQAGAPTDPSKGGGGGGT
eukprot:GHVS01000702.1.p1 GENE.GHVS01000702.1~~GHVS01000702.1.p1  ORF type:complete len:130 (-),score=37.43 GHVS01000702.1:553-942(-)